MPSFRLETPIKAAPADCFELSLSVEAHTATMTQSGERAVAGVTSGLLGPGDQVTWQARHFGVPFRMTSLISSHQPPRRFVDEQVRGPFRSWWHEHLFLPTADGGTRMIDNVRFRAPFGPLGRLVERAVLTHYLQHLIERRNTWLAAELDGKAAPPEPHADNAVRDRRNSLGD